MAARHKKGRRDIKTAMKSQRKKHNHVQPQQQPPKDPAVTRQRQRDIVARSILLGLLDALPVSHIRRVTIHQSLLRDCTGAHAREIVMEGVVLSIENMLDIQERLIQCLLDDRWDVLHAIWKLPTHQPSGSTGNEFLDFRRMMLMLVRTSRKVHNDETVREGVKKLILQTHNETELMDLLERMLQRTCGEQSDTKAKILQDVATGRFYRLLLPDRFDCEEQSLDEQKMPANNNAGVSINDNDNDSSTCPICMDAFYLPRQLDCQHIFCRNCLNDWIRQQRRGRKQSWGCPICRQTYHHHWA